MTDTPKPFHSPVSDEAVNDLRRRLGATRWPDQLEGTGWSLGTDTEILRVFVEYWTNDYDWRAREREIDRLPQFTASVDGHDIHFVHVRAEGPGDTTPILLLHGWPGSFLQMRRLIPLLVSAEGGGAAFDVVVPSLLGFGWSSRPTKPGMSVAAMAPLIHTLMTDVLGYRRYAIRSGDIGAGLATAIASDHPHAIVGHHTGGTNPYIGQVPDDLSKAEKSFVEQAQQWMQQEMAYAQLQSSKPQTLANALVDTPAGLASSLLEKYWLWGDTAKTLEERYGRDELLDTLSLYWFGNTIGSSMRVYAENMRDPALMKAKADVPTAMLMSSKDMFSTPREWVERQSRIDRWTEIDRGGHFLEWEEPELVANDIRAFLADLA